MLTRPISALVVLLCALVAPSARGQDLSRLGNAPTVRVTIQLDTGSVAQFDARDFDLRVAPGGGSPAVAEVRLVKQAGAHTGDLVRLSASGSRVPSALIEVVDSAGIPATSFRLADVEVVSDHVSLSAARASLEQQRLSQQESLSSLTADYLEAQRQLATVEELGKSRVGTRLDLERARDRASDLQRRIELTKQRQALVAGQLAGQGALEETVVLQFGRLDIESAEPGGRATVELGTRPVRRRR